LLGLPAAISDALARADMSFTDRSAARELMDEGPVGPDVLRDLSRVNRLTFAFVPLFRFVRRAGGVGMLLDVACGYGDLLRALARKFPRLRLAGIDLHVDDARVVTPPSIELIGGDVFALDRRFDLIVCSQFTHHLDDQQIVQFLRWIDAHAVRGWYICDLHRHWLPFHFFKIAATALRLHSVVVHDGLISIRRSFVRADWERLLTQAGIEGARIEWFLFRWGVGKIR
jgi:SAM-dependent methyltransferase